MKEVQLLIHLFLLLLSCYGYIQHLRKYIRLELCIGFLFSAIGSILFVVGILNLLKEATLAIWLGGLFLAVRSIRAKENPSNVLSFGTLFFLLGCGFFLVLFPGSEFQHHDSFSHWALVAKIITRQGRYPVGTDYNVLFSAYPVGSACFLFYITQTLGLTSEWVQMFAQTMLMLGMLTGLFAFVKRPCPALITGVVCVFLLCGNTPLTELLVDSLLPLTALNAISLCIYYRRELRDKPWLLLPYAVFLISIKNSGFFFVIILYGCLWYLLGKKPLPLKTWLSLLAVPAGSFFLWQKHVSLVFPAGMLSKHALSLSNYRHVLQDKDPASILKIAQLMLQRMFSPDNQVLWLLLAAFLTWLVWRQLHRDSAPLLGRAILLALLSYLLYQLGTLGMYLFSMPVQESLILASYGRYHASICQLSVGILFIGLMQSLAQLPDAEKMHPCSQILVSLGALLVCLQVLHPSFYMLRKLPIKGTDRYRFDKLIALYEIPQGKDYLILSTEEHYLANEIPYMAQYLLDSHHVYMEPAEDFQEGQLKDYDYLIVFDETESAKAILDKHSPDGAPVVLLK